MDELEQRGELANDAIDKMRQLMQKWNDRLTADRLRLAERYLKGDVEIHIWLRIPGCGDAANFSAVLQYWQSAVRLDAHRAAKADRRGQADCGVKPADDVPLSETRNEQTAVFVDVVKLVEHPDRIVPTTIRLNGINETYGDRINSLYLSSSVGYVFGGSLVNREAGMPARHLPVRLDKLPSKVVQAAAQLMNNLTDDHGQVRRNIGDDLKIIDSLAGLRILLDSQSVRVGFAEGLKPAFKITDVLLGPFDFRPDSDKSV